jgi:hypothetical protein
MSLGVPAEDVNLSVQGSTALGSRIVPPSITTERFKSTKFASTTRSYSNDQYGIGKCESL